jgi:hypothetical protein
MGEPRWGTGDTARWAGAMSGSARSFAQIKAFRSGIVGPEIFHLLVKLSLTSL